MKYLIFTITLIAYNACAMKPDISPDIKKKLENTTLNLTKEDFRLFLKHRYFVPDMELHHSLGDKPNLWHFVTAIDNEVNQFNAKQIDEPEDERFKSIVNRKYKPMSCLRCGATLAHVGTRKFHQGPNFGILGDLGELLVAKESLEMYVCPDCSHVEFFSFSE